MTEISTSAKSPLAVHAACGLFLGILIAWVLFSGSRPLRTEGYDLSRFGRLPVQSGGRIKPLNSEAIVSLRLLSGKSQLRREVAGKRVKVPALVWYIETLLNSGATDDDKVFRIDNPEILDDLTLDAEEKLFSFNDLIPHLSRIQDRARQAFQKEQGVRSRFERNMIELFSRLRTYNNIASALHFQPDVPFSSLVQSYENLVPLALSLPDDAENWTQEQREAAQLVPSLRHVFLAMASEVDLQIVPPERLPTANGAVWQNPYDLLAEAMQANSPQAPALCTALAKMQGGWLDGDRIAGARTYQEGLRDYEATIADNPAVQEKSMSLYLEYIFNRFDLFYRSIVIYVMTFLLLCLSWLKWGKTLRRYAYVLLAFGFTLHTVGLILRVVITERPPVTNLYGSTLFVGWVCVLLGLIVERMFRHGFAMTAATVAGALTLMKGFQIALEGGDTMGVLVAVLDSNFWLATHVICISIGYSACFFAAFIGHIYIFRGIFTRTLDRPAARSMELMTYGIICFGLLFSVIGTILGGIWADQSWGRFWGWDPKENGALLICLWLIVILHARLGGYLHQRGTMIAAAFASVITAVSWFGVNLLGTGLHSYGFTERGLFSFMLFIIIETLIVIVASLLPWKAWASAHHLRPPPEVGA